MALSAASFVLALYMGALSGAAHASSEISPGLKRLLKSDEGLSAKTSGHQRSRRDATASTTSTGAQDCRSCGGNPMPIFARNYTARTCLDHMERGASRCGHYVIDDGKESYVVFCDINTEIGFAWTLIESIALKHNSFVKSKALYVDWPINENSPNWNMYRLSLGRMSRIRDHSTYWRATCEFPSAGIDYRDYVRAKVADVDPLTYSGAGTCKTVEYINIRGHVGVKTTAPFWNSGAYHMHMDSSYTTCGFKAKSGSVSSEDNWGYYAGINSKFRCTSSADSTTQYWMGDYVKRRGGDLSTGCKGCGKVY